MSTLVMRRDMRRSASPTSVAAKIANVGNRDDVVCVARCSRSSQLAESPSAIADGIAVAAAGRRPGSEGAGPRAIAARTNARKSAARSSTTSPGTRRPPARRSSRSTSTRPHRARARRSIVDAGIQVPGRGAEPQAERMSQPVRQAGHAFSAMAPVTFSEAAPVWCAGACQALNVDLPADRVLVRRGIGPQLSPWIGYRRGQRARGFGQRRGACLTLAGRGQRPRRHDAACQCAPQHCRRVVPGESGNSRREQHDEGGRSEVLRERKLKPRPRASGQRRGGNPYRKGAPRGHGEQESTPAHSPPVPRDALGPLWRRSSVLRVSAAPGTAPRTG